jgi:hypothetical protein
VIEARCSCGALTARVPGPSRLVVACHCTECQRRTGAPFGAGAFYPAGEVRIAGAASEYTRAGASGGAVRTRFCPACGSSVYWTAERAPGFVAVAVGCFPEAEQPRPARSVWEESQRGWVQVEADRHHPQGA